MLNCFLTEANTIISIAVILPEEWEQWLHLQPEPVRTWLAVTQFKAEPGALRLIPAANGKIAKVLCCIANKNDHWRIAPLPLTLPEGVYQFEVMHSAYAIGWGLGAYQYDRYKQPQRQPAQLILTQAEMDTISITMDALYFVRDCINAPAEDMGPTQFAAIAQAMAEEYGATFKQCIGTELLEQSYPAIYAVGRASDDPPRLLEIRWGNISHPKVSLVGKGVCFDTGGLDLKPSVYMQWMKKDMAGGAHVLGLAKMIMAAQLPISLRVLIPVVENAVSGNAYRPGDIIKSRKGTTIEIGNTDAEGRVILADALTEAASEHPDLLIDIATLTGAASVALGAEIAAVFSHDNVLVNAILELAETLNDPIWRLPLAASYREYLNSPIADISNNPSESRGSAITAALFLNEFVPNTIPWLHFDLMAWNVRARPGRPLGGEAMAIRALFAYLQEHFAS